MDERTRPLRVLTWNIHGCVGRDRKYDADRIGRVVRSIAPDIAAFQEIDSRNDIPGQPEMFECLRAHVGNHGHEAWSITGADSRYGQMLASRYPLTGCREHDISVAGLEPRRVIEAVAQLPSGRLRLVATHLGLRHRERARQFDLLHDIVAADLTLPIVLLGDLNEWRGYRIRRHPLFAVMGAVTRHASFPSGRPFLALDRIVCRPANLMIRSGVVNSARMASDHLPLVANLTLPVAETEGTGFEQSPAGQKYS